MIPIQITNGITNGMTNSNGEINQRPGQSCNNYNGNLDSWTYGLNKEFKEKLMKEQASIGKLAQFDTVNSPYYTQVTVNPEYVQYLKNVTNC